LSLSTRFDDGILTQMANNPYEDLPAIEMTPEILHAVRAQVDATGDPSSSTIRKAAEDAYQAEHGYTVDEHHRYVTLRGDTSAWYADPHAVRRDIEQMRKEDLHLATAFA
jgi:hypothetical protein